MTKHKLLRAIFSKAAKLNIGQDEIRESVADSVIGKRLSAATPKELLQVIEHLAKLQGNKPGKSYEASKAGLIAELEDIAEMRWGKGYETPLNAFINSSRKAAVTHYRFMSVTALKGIKNRLRKMNEQDQNHAG